MDAAGVAGLFLAVASAREWGCGVRVLLTGAAGFIGSAIRDQLATAGHDVVAMDLLIPAAHGPQRPPWAPHDLMVADVRDGDMLDELLPGVDVVCHQAAMVGLGVHAGDAPAYVSHNVSGTAELLAAMARQGTRALVLASSMAVYGDGAYTCAVDGEVRAAPRTGDDLAAGHFDPRCPRCAGPLVWRSVAEDATPHPQNNYAATKLAQEHLAFAWAQQVGGRVTALRYHNVYGPRMPRNTPYAGVASIFRSALAQGRAPSVYEDGRQMRDFVHVSDVARCNVLAMLDVFAGPKSRGSPLVCNVASGEPRTVGELAAALAVACDGPEPEVVGGGRPGDVRHIVADPGRARTVLGFAAQVPFAAGIVDFVNAPMRAPVVGRDSVGGGR